MCVTLLLMPEETPKSGTAFTGPPPPKQGQLFVDRDGGFWKVARVTMAGNPAGFYLLHLAYGKTLDSLGESLIVGPREFTALARDQDLKPHPHSA
jgi:hypothetical protein